MLRAAQNVEGLDVLNRAPATERLTTPVFLALGAKNGRVWTAGFLKIVPTQRAPRSLVRKYILIMWDRDMIYGIFLN